MNEMEAAAHGYAERGWPNLPVEPRQKKPLGRLVGHGLHDATVDHNLISRWYRAEPYANIGLCTGVCFDTLDSDGEEAKAAFPCDLQSGEPPICGPTVVTGRGSHCYVAPSGLGSRKLAPAVDYKGRNGYVLAPPSVHPSGAVYRWYAGEDDPDRGIDAPIRPAPLWLVALLYPSAVTEGACAPQLSVGPLAHRQRKRYGRRVLEYEIGRVASAQQGERNITLNLAAFRLGQLIPTGTMDLYTALDALVQVAERVGLPTTEAESTIASGLRAGANKPRRS
jgi:hypothetical protein